MASPLLVWVGSALGGIGSELGQELQTNCRGQTPSSQSCRNAFVVLTTPSRTCTLGMRRFVYQPLKCKLRRAIVIRLAHVSRASLVCRGTTGSSCFRLGQRCPQQLVARFATTCVSSVR